MSVLLALNPAPVPPFPHTHENWMMPDATNVPLSAAYYAQCVTDTDGVLYPVSWLNMEIVEGIYNFSTIINALDYVHARGKKLIARVFYKSYSGAAAKPLPAYILNDEATYGGAVNSGGLCTNAFGGYTPRFDNVNVMARFKALITAMAIEIHSHPALRGVGPDESAWSFGAGFGATGLKAAQVRAAHREKCLHFQSCFPGKEVYPFYNYCDGSTNAEIVAELKWSLEQGMCAGITDTHRVPEMLAGVQPVASVYPVPQKTIMCVDFLSSGANDSGLTERYLENARQTAAAGADITVWYTRGGASSSYWAAAVNAMSIVG